MQVCTNICTCTDICMYDSTYIDDSSSMTKSMGQSISGARPGSKTLREAPNLNNEAPE